jgi:hypothetical protein
MNTLLYDLRYALRQLRRAPGFAFTVLLTLALSVGVATAVFCVFDTVMLRPLPYDHPEKIVDIQTTSRSGYGQPSSWPSYQDERKQAKSFAALAGFDPSRRITVETPSNGPVSLDCVRSSDNFFQVFGIRPLLGRTYAEGENLDGKNDIVVLSYEVWQRYFGGDRGVLNQTVKLDGRASTVIGIMPAGFRYPLYIRNAVYTPRILGEQNANESRFHNWLMTVGRLGDGVSIEQAQADLSHVFNDLRPDSAAGILDEKRDLGWQRPTLDIAGRGAGGAGHRLHQRNWPLAGAGRQEGARNGYALGHRRGARAVNSPGAHGRVAAGSAGRG